MAAPPDLRSSRSSRSSRSLRSLRASALAALLLLTACGPRPAKATAPGETSTDPASASRASEPLPPGAAGEAPPTRERFGETLVANLFSHPGPLVGSDVDLGADWAAKGKAVWAISFTAKDESFAPVTMILFEGRYRGLTITDNQRDLLRRSRLYKDLDFGDARLGYALRASGPSGDADETALIPSPKRRFELLVMVNVPAGGPKEAPGAEAYRSLLMEHTVRLMETVAKGLSEAWIKPR